MSRSEKTGFGIVGAGNIAPFHAQGVNACERAELAAICDRDAVRGKELAAQHDVKFYQDLGEMLQDPEVQAITVATPSGTHMDVSRAAAEAGVHVLVEKPIDVTLERSRIIVENCRRHGVKLGVVFQRRTYPELIRVKQAIDKGELGKILLCELSMKYYRNQDYYDSGEWRGTWKLDGGGALMNQGIHGIDALCWMLGEPESVIGRVATTSRDIEVEDLGMATVKFSSGAFGYILGATATNPGESVKMVIHGDRGTIKIDDAAIDYWAVSDDPNTLAAPIELGEQVSSLGGAADPTAISPEGHIKLVEDFADAIISDREPLVSGEEGMKALRLISAIYKSSNEGREVMLAEMME